MSDQPPFCPKHGPHEGMQCPQCLELDRARDIVQTTYIPPAEKSEQNQTPPTSNPKIYAVGERECWKLGEHYTRHSLAMTAEGLHKKSDIAAELAVRDAEIARLTRERDVWKSKAVHRGESASRLRAIVAEQQHNCSCPYGDCSTCDKARAALSGEPTSAPETGSDRLPALVSLALNVVAVEERCSNLARFPEGCGECLYCKATRALRPPEKASGEPT